MFARLKDNGSGAIYVLIVHNYRVRTAWGRAAKNPKQRVIANVGRVDDRDPEERKLICKLLTQALEGIVPPKFRKRARAQRAHTEAEILEGYGGTEPCPS